LEKGEKKQEQKCSNILDGGIGGGDLPAVLGKERVKKVKVGKEGTFKTGCAYREDRVKEGDDGGRGSNFQFSQASGWERGGKGG